MTEFEATIARLSSPFTKMDANVRGDVGRLIRFAKLFSDGNVQLRREMQGAVRTMLAITKTMGVVELPHRLIEELDPKDSLNITDVETPHGLMKRFSFVPSPDKVTETA